jgi:hypothetical protein
MIVVKLEDKTTLAVSAVIDHEQGMNNMRDSQGRYEKDDVNRDYIWKCDGKDVMPPRPTMLSTLVALTMCAPAPVPDDLWITDMSTSTSVPANSLRRVHERTVRRAVRISTKPASHERRAK